MSLPLLCETARSMPELKIQLNPSLVCTGNVFIITQKVSAIWELSTDLDDHQAKLETWRPELNSICRWFGSEDTGLVMADRSLLLLACEKCARTRNSSQGGRGEHPHKMFSLLRFPGPEKETKSTFKLLQKCDVFPPQTSGLESKVVLGHAHPYP